MLIGKAAHHAVPHVDGDEEQQHAISDDARRGLSMKQASCLLFCSGFCLASLLLNLFFLSKATLLQESKFWEELPANAELTTTPLPADAKLTGITTLLPAVAELTGLRTPEEEAIQKHSMYWKDVHVYVGPERVWGQVGKRHAQIGQDWLVASMLGCKQGGFFLDLAANEPDSFSNTLMLERDFGWNGICVEANKKWLYGLAQRKCKLVMGVAGSPSNQEVKFALRPDGTGLAGIVDPAFDNTEEELVKGYDTLRTVRIEELLGRLNAPQQIDFFSLDVEGAESMVMKNFNWDSYRFSIITIERPKPDLIKILNDSGYKQIRTNADSVDFTWADSRHSRFKDWAATWANHPDATEVPASCIDALGYQRPTAAELKP